jgi:protein-tyrosine-phosphatase
MKILFVCLHNIGRSQIAKAFYNHLTESSDADAAGLDADSFKERFLRDFGETNGMRVMREIDIEMGDFPRYQLTERLAEKYDLIITMAADDEIPTWLENSPKFRRWPVEVPKMPHGSAMLRPMRDEIERLVCDLIRENHE